MAGNMMDLSKFNIDAPRWDQSTFMGRLKHFFNITDPRTVGVSNANLDKAKDLVDRCRAGTLLPGTTKEQLLYAKKLYDSAFHPDSGDRMNLIGRMSFQVPGGMAITGLMLQFYRSVPAVVFWQWVNQSFNALVNYTNRNAASPITAKQIGVAYLTATSTALATAVGLNLYTKIAAVKGITQVVISRVTMAAPGMIILPIIMEKLEKYPFMQRIKFFHAPLQVTLVGCFLIFMVPAACSLFPQRCSMATSKLDPELKESITTMYGDKVKYVYFNKGL
ncbi:sideroflexin-2 isoform X2 [Leucoraja erinacea]|uniref:sideroflexin-2 isoform X2 n=1 Tax=Leucoraja erinaceus TaxID=7782 RepID=UPI002458E96C|nr:sideroflexin-2 isoform X2 [Leucoraja erinacea]